MDALTIAEIAAAESALPTTLMVAAFESRNLLPVPGKLGYFVVVDDEGPVNGIELPIDYMDWRAHQCIRDYIASGVYPHSMESEAQVKTWAINEHSDLSGAVIHYIDAEYLPLAACLTLVDAVRAAYRKGEENARAWDFEYHIPRARREAAEEARAAVREALGL